MGLSLGGGNNETVLKITADADGAVKGFQQVEDAQKKLELGTISLNKSTDEFSNKYVTLSGGLGAAAIGITAAAAAAAGLVAVTLKLAERGEVYGSLKDAFEGLGGSSKTIDDVVSRTQGLVTQADALKIANQALVKGFPDVNKNFADVAALGATLADALGQETAPAIEKLTKAISLGKVGLAAQVGLFIDSKQALKDYAAETGQTVKQLDAFEKKTAIQNALLTAARAKLAEMGEVTDSVANANESLRNRITDALDVIGDAINRNPELTKTIRDMSDALAGVNWDQIGSDLSGWISTTARGISNLKSLVSDIRSLIPSLPSFDTGIHLNNGDNVRKFAQDIKILGELKKQYSEGGLAALNFASAQLRVHEATLNAGEGFKALGAKTKAEKEAVAEAAKYADKLTDSINKGTKETNTNAGAHDKAGGAVKKHKEKVYELMDISKEIADSVLKHKFTPEIQNLTQAFNLGLTDANGLAASLERLRAEFTAAGGAAKDFDSIISSQDFGGKPKDPKKAVAAYVEPHLEFDFAKFIKNNLGTNEAASQAIADALGSALSSGFQLATDQVKTGKETLAGHYAEAIGGLVGAAIGAYFAGPAGAAVGAAAGNFLGALVDKGLSNAGDSQAKARKSIEKYVEQVFIDYNNIVVGKSGKATPFINVILGLDGGKLKSGVIEGPLKEYVFDLEASIQSILFGGKGANTFGANSPFNQWLENQMVVAPEVTNAFLTLGASLAEKLGVGFQQGEQVFGILLAQLGPTEEGFNNLKVIALELGLTLEESTQSMVDLFKKGQTGALETETNIQSLNEIFAAGRVGVGDYTGAIEDLIASGGTGIRAIKDLKDIAVEGQQAGIKTLDDLKNKLIANGTLSVEQANALFGSIASNGIKTLEELTQVSDRSAISILAGAEAAGFAFGKNFDQLTEQLEQADKALTNTQGLIETIPELQEKRVNFVVTADIDPNAKKFVDEYNTKRGVGVPQ